MSCSVLIDCCLRALHTAFGYYTLRCPLPKTRTSSRYETIMSYSCGFFDESINYFSNPDVSVMGLPTGVADEADCARRIRDTMVRERHLKRKLPG